MVVAARDEAERIAATLAALARAFPRAPVWVADDGSVDATGELARAAGARVVRSERAVGKGAAVTRAAREALRDANVPIDEPRATIDELPTTANGPLTTANGPLTTTRHTNSKSIFVLCDGDLGDSALELAALADAVARGDADVAVGAFATRAGGGFGLALGFARWAIRRRCGLQTVAPISGQRALSERALRDTLPFAGGFGMEVGMTIDAVRAGHRVLELELQLAHRATGRTPAGFAHRARQLADFARVYVARR